MWPPETPFEKALGPLAGLIDLVALRTCKADVIVGLEKGQAEAMDQRDASWRANGAWAGTYF